MKVKINNNLEIVLDSYREEIKTANGNKEQDLNITILSASNAGLTIDAVSDQINYDGTTNTIVILNDDDTVAETIVCKQCVSVTRNVSSEGTDVISVRLLR